MNLFTHALVLAETADAPAGGGLVSLLPFLIIGLLFYFLIIRPQRKRQSEQQQLLRRVSVGDDIVTIGGFHGTIVALTDDEMELEIAPGVVTKMARNAISRSLTPPTPFTLDDDDLDDLDDFDEDEFDDLDGNLDDRAFDDGPFDDSDFDDGPFDDGDLEGGAHDGGDGRDER